VETAGLIAGDTIQKDLSADIGERQILILCILIKKIFIEIFLWIQRMRILVREGEREKNDGRRRKQDLVRPSLEIAMHRGEYEKILKLNIVHETYRSWGLTGNIGSLVLIRELLEKVKVRQLRNLECVNLIEGITV
jgi:hypothetical protein